MSSHVPFNQLDFSGNELQYAREAMEQNRHTSGDGPFSHRCAKILQETIGAPRVLLTTSGTHALELAALLLNFREGDEVLVPSFTFPSSVNAFLLRGMRPVFVDVRSDTLNIDEKQLEKRLTKHTRAIVPVHYGGVACEMDTIVDFAKRNDLAVIEDNAHGLFGTYRNRQLGTFGVLAAQSFHETKNFSAGEGGALVINDRQLAERAEVLREKGTNRNRFFRGEVDKYGWVDIGSSFVISDILAGILYAQLERREAIQSRRRVLWNAYYDGLRNWAGENGVKMPHVPAECGQAYHLFYLMLPSLADRQRLIAHLQAANIKSVFHYQPLHASEMGKRLGKQAPCPVSEWAGDCLLRLPMFNQLSDLQQARVIESVRQFKCTDTAEARLAG